MFLHKPEIYKQQKINSRVSVKANTVMQRMSSVTFCDLIVTQYAANYNVTDKTQF
jgi:hypothetical protein